MADKPRPQLDNPAQCYCGAVKLHVKGALRFSVLCHCKPCTRFRGVSPVHLVGVAPADGVAVTEGAEHVGRVTDSGGGKMEHFFCKECGCGLYQSPEGAGFRAVYPVNFRFEDGPTLTTLPEEMLPTVHSNYDNRSRPFRDGLPKRYPGGVFVDDDGNPIPPE